MHMLQQLLIQSRWLHVTHLQVQLLPHPGLRITFGLESLGV